MAIENDDIRQALQTLTQEVTSLRTAIVGDSMGNDGLVKTFKEHVARDEKRYEAQVNWNNDKDRKIAWYIGGAAGVGLALQVIFTIIPSIIHSAK